MNALVFPGQGSQKVGMAKALVEKFPWAAEMAEKTDRILGRNLTQICFEGPESLLKETVNTQPGLFFVSAVLTEALKREKFDFQAAAGHSLGEYSALYASGAATYEDLLNLVVLRAKAMQKACVSVKGTMAAIMMLDRKIVEEICNEVSILGSCVIANLNCPGQLVISGGIEAVKSASEKATKRGARKVIPLEVSGPFHSPLMEPAKAELAEAIKNADFKDANVPVFTNVDALPTTDHRQLKQKLLDQLIGTVKWEDCVLAMWRSGCRKFVELGPGKVISGLIKKIVPEAVIDQAQDPESLTKLFSAQSTN